MCFRGGLRVAWGVFLRVFCGCLVAVLWVLRGGFVGALRAFWWAFCGLFMGFLWVFCGRFGGCSGGRLCALCGIFLRIMPPEVGIGSDRQGSEGSDIGSRYGEIS